MGLAVWMWVHGRPRVRCGCGRVGVDVGVGVAVPGLGGGGQPDRIVRKAWPGSHGASGQSNGWWMVRWCGGDGRCD